MARLRITVFREWPYLYEGSLDYESAYLKSLAGSAHAIIVGAFDGANLVGASTGSPMEDHADGFQMPLDAAGLSASDVFYCAESILLPDYRGQGLGHRFFDLREDHGRRLGRHHSVFCAVTRPADHPARPVDYRPLDPFWRKRGYDKIPGAFARFSWPDVGDVQATEKSLQLWSRRL